MTPDELEAEELSQMISAAVAACKEEIQAQRKLAGRPKGLSLSSPDVLKTNSTPEASDQSPSGEKLTRSLEALMKIKKSSPRLSSFLESRDKEKDKEKEKEKEREKEKEKERKIKDKKAAKEKADRRRNPPSLKNSQEDTRPKEKEKEISFLEPVKVVSAPRTPLRAIPDGHADRSVGVLLGCMVGDILGAPIEGRSRQELKAMKSSNAADWKLRDFVSGIAMGTNEIRFGMYTDDTQSLLALAASLVSGPFDAHAIAVNYSSFFHHKPQRGYPNTAQIVLMTVASSPDGYRNSARRCFKDGSFANGAAMRIAPVGVAFRNAPDSVLREAVRLAVVSSHVHPEAVDGAYIIAKAVALLCQESTQSFDPVVLLSALEAVSSTDVIRQRIGHLMEARKKILRGEEVDDDIILKEICDEPDFQIKTRDAVPCALWALARYGHDPISCIIEAVNFGGDADTVGAIAGALVGALHGAKWIPEFWDKDIENEEYGRDYAIQLGIRLSSLDCKDIPATQNNQVP